ncbi:MAG: SAM-dependent methyltransferase [archaeon]|jgi:ribosome biogenesis SPOUT family RNA methylase Rps3|nr:SAM-dependent methyltransferase [archaeon]
MPVYIIEHLEPEIWEWCLMEYENISKIAGRANLWFTNINSQDRNAKKLEKFGKVIHESVATLGLKNACILDPEVPKTLEPEEAKSFDYFIFGGILGDYPPRKRTSPELTSKLKNAQARNIGKKQFSTDNAVLVTKRIIEGTPLKDMHFVENLTIPINEIESIDLPYCYPLVDGKPQISGKLINYLKKKKSF